MKRIILLLVIALLATVSARGQFALISRHQQWADSAYAKPAAMESRQLTEAAMNIIYHNLQEASATRLLEHLAKELPGLDGYIAMRHAGTVDTLRRNALRATDAIADFASRKWPDSFFANWCRYRSYALSSYIRDMENDWNRLIASQEKLLRKSPTADNKALLAMMRIQQIIGRTLIQSYNDPDDVKRVFDIDRQALEAFPLDSSDTSLLRAELYYELAEVKSLFANDQSAEIYFTLSGSDTHPEYLRTGSFGIPALYGKAAEIAMHSLTEGHPFVRIINSSGNQFRLNNTASEQAMATSKKEYDYIRQYYPLNSFEIAVSRVVRCLDSMRQGVPTADDLFLADDMDLMESVLGISNPMYLQYLLQAAAARTLADPDDPEWADRLHKALKTAGIDETSPLTLLYDGYLIGNQFQTNPEKARELMTAHVEKYRRHHTPDLLSVTAGNAIKDFYLYYLNNTTMALEVSATVKEDLSKIYGRKVWQSPYCWNLDLERINMLLEGHPAQIDSLYGPSLRILDLQKDYPERKFLRYNVLRSWVNAKINAGDQQGAALIMKDCCEAAKCWKESEVNTLADYATVLMNLGAPASTTDSLIARARHIINSTPEGTVTSISFTPLITYYMNRGDWESALDMAQRQLEVYDMQYGDAYTNDHITMRSTYADILDRLNRKNEASRVRAENNEMTSRQFNVSPSPQMLDVLWNDYYQTRNNNIYDYAPIMGKIQDIIQKTVLLVEYSGTSPQFMYSYMIRALAEIVYVPSYCWTQMLNEYENVPEQYKEQYETILDNVNKAFDMYVPWLEQLVEGFKTYDPNYRVNADYNNGLHHLSAYYNFVKDDIDKAITLNREIYDNRTFPEDRYSSAADLMFLNRNAGNMDEARRYADICEELLPACQATIEDGLKSNLRGFRIDDLVSRGEYAAALPYAREEYAEVKRVLDGNFQLMTSKEQNDFMNSHGDPAAPLAVMLQFMPEALSGEVYNAVVYRTGMQLRSQRDTRDAVARSSDPKVKALVDSLAGLQTRAAAHALAFNPMATPEESNAYVRATATLSSAINRVEQQILDLTASLRQGSVADVAWEQVRDRLGRDEAALEYVYSGNRVMALLLRRHYKQPLAVNLGECAALAEKLSRNGRNSAAMARSLYRDGDTTLYNILWRGLEPHLKGVSTVYHTMPGILSAVALNAIATPEGKTMFDKYNLVQLTTTAQLVFDAPAIKADGISMMGDILYSPTQKATTPATPGARDVDMDYDLARDVSFDDMPGDEGTRAVKTDVFRHLPFTALELDSIDRLFPAGRVDSVRRLNATEARLRHMIADSPAILHLATHGYYMTTDRDLSRHPFFRKHGIGSMQRSGVALAGAELAWRGNSTNEDDNDGILTAAEIADLDMKKTGLVTLSACETALGDFSFEGIFGLQRGFKQAGVKSLLVSLWSVNDYSTSLFMTSFYASLRDGKPMQKAWRDAVDTVRLKYPSPYYWAPFILLDGSR